MFFISYAGMGPLVVVFGAAAVGLGIWADAHHVTSGTGSAHVTFLLWALSCILFGRWVNSSKKDRLLFDPATQEEVVLKTRHSLYGIQIEYWGFIILVIPLLIFYNDIQSGKIDLKHIMLGTAGSSASEAALSDDLIAGQQAYSDKKYKEALASFSRAADRGEADAQFYLGVMLANGFGVDKDYDRALVWFRKAAEQGEAKSQDYIGYSYENGLGRPAGL